MSSDKGASRKTSRKSDREIETKERNHKVKSNNSGRTNTVAKVSISKSQELSRSKNSNIEKSSKEKLTSRNAKDLELLASTKLASSVEKNVGDKIKSVNRDINNDLIKIKESLSKNQVSRNTPLKATTRSTVLSKTSSEGSVYSRLASKSRVVKKPASVQENRKTSQLTLANASSSTTKIKEKAPSTKKVVPEKNTSKSHLTENNKSDKINSKGRTYTKLGRDRTRTRTLSPHEVKITRGYPSQEILDKSNVRQEKVASEKTAAVSNLQTGHGDEPVGDSENSNDPGDDYENDFEDYESDFEEDISNPSYISNSSSNNISDENAMGSEEDSEESEMVELSRRPVVEEEKKLDSGNYDLSEKRKGREIQQIKEALEKENAALPLSDKRSGTYIRENYIGKDEGFDEEKFDEKRIFDKSKQTGFINFSNARKRMQDQKMSAKTKKRGEELLSMIKLDTVAFTLLDLAPASYEAYVKCFGRSNTVQVSVQTNEDNISEEVETDPIIYKNKWTQHPVAFKSLKNIDGSIPLIAFSHDCLGVGSDTDDIDPNIWKQQLKFNTVRLNRFLLSAGQIMLHILESNVYGQGKIFPPSGNMSFLSTGVISLDIESIEFLSRRPVKSLSFCRSTPNMVLTVHSECDEIETEISDPSLRRCMVCVWNILKPSNPKKILICSENVSVACFGTRMGYIVYGGMHDGAVCLWDLREPTAAHNIVNTNKGYLIVQSPTYSTAEVLKNNGHLAKIVALHTFSNNVLKEQGLSNNSSPMQLCSLDLSGILIVWTVVQNVGTGLKSGIAEKDLGLAHWGRVRLVQSITINIMNSIDVDQHISLNIEFHDLIVDLQDSNHILISTNIGHIIHCLITEGKPQPRIYTSNDALCPATCLENCPFAPFFLAGGRGMLYLFNKNSSQSRITLSTTADVFGQGPAINAIQWLSAHPGTFFVLDSSSSLHMWNLLLSDIHPVQSVSFGEHILSMKLSYSKTYKQHFLALTTACGQVHLYQLKDELCHKSQAVFEEELKRFLLYTSLL